MDTTTFMSNIKSLYGKPLRDKAIIDHQYFIYVPEIAETYLWMTCGTIRYRGAHSNRTRDERRKLNQIVTDNPVLWGVVVPYTLNTANMVGAQADDNIWIGWRPLIGAIFMHPNKKFWQSTIAAN